MLVDPIRGTSSHRKRAAWHDVPCMAIFGVWGFWYDGATLKIRKIAGERPWLRKPR